MMRLRSMTVLGFAALVLLYSACGKRPDSETTVPKGFGVLTVLVQDEDGKPVEGAEVSIENSKAERFAVKTGKDGRTRGAGQVSLSPFSVGVVMSGFEPQQKQGVVLSESQRVIVLFTLRRSKP